MMSVTALVMAGGKGTRMVLSEEKPLLNVGGKPVIELVIEALKSAKSVDLIVVAVSKYTPKTAKHLEKFPVKVLQTPGNEYVSDMGVAIKALNLQTVLAIAADLPLITSEIVDQVVERYFSSGKPALAVVVPSETKKNLQMSSGYAFDHNGVSVVPTGINVVDGRRIDEFELDQDIYVVNKAEVAVNVNTLEELRIANDKLAEIRGL
jgi:adenosylcobinamide-phosphate guanylyltransferase